MSTIFLIFQGFLVGFLAGNVYPNFEWQFFAIIVANAVLTVSYGSLRSNE